MPEFATDGNNMQPEGSRNLAVTFIDMSVIFCTGSDREITAGGDDTYWTTFDDGTTALVTETDLEVTEDMFRNNHMTVECRLHGEGNLVLLKEEMNLERTRRGPIGSGR